MRRNRIALLVSLVLHASAIGALFGASNVTWKISSNAAASPVILMDAVEVEPSETAPARPPQQEYRREKLARADSQLRRKTAQPAPSPGSSSAAISAGKGASAISAYLARVRDKLSREIRAPRDLVGRPMRVTLEMTLMSDGAITQTSIRQSSGSPGFDQSVLEATRRAVPFPHFSSQMGTVQRLTVRIPVEIRSGHGN